MKPIFKSFVAVVVALSMLTLNCPLMASEISQAVSSSTAGVTTEITYDPAEEAAAGQRIPIQVVVTDDDGVDVVRIYFRAAAAKNYTYVTLNGSGDIFTGILPAPANGAGDIDYLILVKNGNNQILKSQNYQMIVKDSDDVDPATIVANNEKIEVFTELLEAPSTLEGFMDNIVINVAESVAKYGVSVGIYSVLEAGSSTTAAVSTGTVAASAGVASTTTMILATIGAVAVVGGGVAVASGGSSSSGTSSGTVSSKGVVGKWQTVAINSTCPNLDMADSCTMEFFSNMTYSKTCDGRDIGGYSYSVNSNTILVNIGGGSTMHYILSEDENTLTQTYQCYSFTYRRI